MSFDPASLFASILIGSVGLAVFVYGKRQRRAPQLVIGLVLMVFPYFVPDALLMAGLAAALLAALWAATRFGW